MANYYKPELNRTKAKLFARCFNHCLTCPDFNINEGEQRILLHFCNIVGEKEFVEETVSRLAKVKEAQLSEEEQKKKDESWEQIENYMRKKREAEKNQQDQSDEDQSV